jgi:hypothetical protein
MLYDLYQANLDVLGPVRSAARLLAGSMPRSLPGQPNGATGPVTALLDAFANSATTHRRPEYGIPLRQAGPSQRRRDRGGNARNAVRHIAALRER